MVDTFRDPMRSAELRSSLYFLLSDYFAFPDTEGSPLLDRETLSEVASLFAIDQPQAVEGVTIHELQTAYTGLFINRLGGVQAHLYGAVYIESEPRLMGESTRAVFAAYQAAGVNPEESTEPPDALSLELAFMAHLAGEQARALSVDNPEVAEEFLRRQSSFCEKFLHPWVFEFCRRVGEDETAHPLYRWGTQLLACFSHEEERCFSE